MPLYLPRNLSALSKVCASHNPRYSVTGVLLKDKGDGAYEAVATDGRILAIVNGPRPAGDDIPAAESAPNGGTEGVIDRDELAGVFKLPDAPGKRKSVSPVGLALSAENRWTAATNAATCQGAGVEGRFPCYREILPTVPKRKPVVTIRLDPVLLAKLLTAAAATVCDDENKGVELEIFDPTHPAVVRARNSDGRTFEGAIMPLS